MKKILIIGKNGMLGSELYERLNNNSSYITQATALEDLDICNKENVLEVVNAFKPDYIINCAAYTNVDGCESNVELANNVNGSAIKNLAEAANTTNATLIQISTDYVFNGNLPLEKIYTEDMETEPVNAYGVSKLIGENYAKTANKYYILRTAWLYGNGKNFVRTMLNLSKTHNEINVVSDQFGSPTSTTTLCEIIEKILEKNPEYGIYHSTNEGFISWYDFAKKIFEIKNIDIKVNPILSKDYPTVAKRPFNSKLSKEKLHSIGIFPEEYESALKKYLESN